MPSNRITVGLLSHYLQDVNLGCIALSVSNIALLDEVAAANDIAIDYKLIVNEKHPEIDPSFTSSPVEYRYFDSAKATVKRPDRYVRSRVFDGCDLVVNINAGDGFTDLYGPGRVFSESYMSLLAQFKGVPVVMAPQTIGPFDRRWSRAIASRVLRNCRTVFSRDALSTALALELGAQDVREVIDVAFALPFEADASLGKAGVLNVGVNVSGLLYRGGYNRNNYFNLSFDYREFIHTLVGDLVRDGHHVHLVAHVVAQDGAIEDDYSACRDVSEMFPEAVLAPRFSDAIEVKSYIASLDFFTGARMHSTIAAASSGVPVVPIGYSKKLNGLFDTLDYPYYIDARANWTLEQAVDQLNAWVQDRAKLHAQLQLSRRIYATRLDAYRRELGAIMRTLSQSAAK